MGMTWEPAPNRLIIRQALNDRKHEQLTQVSDPCKGELGRGNPLSICNRSELFDDLDVMSYVLRPENGQQYQGLHRHPTSDLFAEAVILEAKVILTEVRTRFDSSGEETSTERSVGNYGYSEVFGCGDD